MAYPLFLRKGALLIASFTLLWLAACETLHTESDSPPAGLALTPSETLMPIPSATGSATLGDDTGTISIAPQVVEDVGRFELIELEILTDITAANPFDPEELDIRVEFTSPSGTTAEVGAFWYQDFAAGGSPLGDAGWRVRYTPAETGAWTAVARIPARGLQSEPAAFQVLPSGHPGFVRVHPENPRYLAFDDGSFFFPIGLNMGWWSGAGSALLDYRKWMDPFAANGGNTIRVWMAEWSFGLEWNDTPLGDYTHRLRQAWFLDQIFNMAEERGVYIMLVLLNCADFNDWQTNGWNGNPYNDSRGGPLERPEQFATDPAARALLQRRLNYIANRWGYSPNLLAWEWWNEVNLTPISDQALIPWLQEMTAYLRARDVNRHLTTNSYAIRDLSPIWQLPEIDIIQKHEYSDQIQSADRDLAERAVPDLRKLAASAPAKPVMLGEFGYGAETDADQVETTGIHLHNGIWATSFAGYAGSGMYWYWDVYVERYHLWRHFRNLDAFIGGIDLSRYEPFSPLEISGPGGLPGGAVGLGLRGDDVLIWLRSEAYTTQASIAAREDAGLSGVFTYNPPLVEGWVLTLREMGDAQYTVYWYDPHTGAWLEPVSAAAQEGRLSINIPRFRHDLAARIVKDR
jgi:hypothetical protein